MLTFPAAYGELLEAPSPPSDLSAATTSSSSNNTSGVKQSVNVLGTAVALAARAPVPRANSVGIRAWVRGVPVDREALAQLEQLSSMSDVVRHDIAVMPDVHGAVGATVGTVIPTTSAIIPGAVGVDIGCGMLAMRTSLTEADLPCDLESLRIAIELAVPHGRTHNGQAANDAGGWRNDIPRAVARVWKELLEPDFRRICAKRAEIENTNNVNHLGSMGSGNHFCELCVDEASRVWIMIHSGSRGVGARIGAVFIEAAKKDMGALISNLPNASLAYVREGTAVFDEYAFAVDFAQRFAYWNRELMLFNVVEALRASKRLPPFTVGAADADAAATAGSGGPVSYTPLSSASAPFVSSSPIVPTSGRAISCHHNYVERVMLPLPPDPDRAGRGGSGSSGEVFLTRKGATSARLGELGIIPGSMGARSHIVRGKGNSKSYCSCSHGAGRRFSRGEATRRFTLDDHIAATAGIACRKDAHVIDETPSAYKDVGAVMDAQRDLVDIVHTLHQRVCVKG